MPEVMQSNNPTSQAPLMSKRSRHASVSAGTDESLSPGVEDECDALAVHAPPTKFSQTGESNSPTTLPSRGIRCALAPHRETLCFDTQEKYEVHYSKEHVNRCVTCSKNFPSPHLLELHIEENHNALREALAARGEKTYGCFVEDCGRKCSTPQKRRLHLIDKHMFPKSYNFRIVDQGIDRASSMLRNGRRRRISTDNGTHRADRHRHWPSPLQQGQLRDSGQGTNNRSSTSDDLAGPIETAESCRLVVPDPALPAQNLNREQATELDNLAQSLSVLRFVPTNVTRKHNRASTHRIDVDSDVRAKDVGHQSGSTQEIVGELDVTST